MSKLEKISLDKFKSSEINVNNLSGGAADGIEQSWTSSRTNVGNNEVDDHTIHDVCITWD